MHNPLPSGLFECLEACFPGIHEKRRLIESIGYSWAKLSTPFFETSSGTVVAHAGVMEFPAIVNGEMQNFAFIHAVGTLPQYRGRGIATRVVGKAVEYAKERADNILLFTDIPSFYEKMGFNVVKESSFKLKMNSSRAAPSTLLPLQKEKKSDLLLFTQILSRRIPISRSFSILDQGAILAFHTLSKEPFFKNLFFCPKLHAILAFQRDGERITLFDVICEKELSLESIEEYIPSKEIEFFFTPDQFSHSFETSPYNGEEGYLMALSLNNLPKKPFMTPLFSRC
jgi:GNAT superfamily N-acetyltransferase